MGSGAEWAGHIQFKTFVSQPFDPTKYADGEHEYNGDHYYVINKQLAYGWQPKTVAGNLQKYYSEANGGRRIDNGWADYYYFTDSNGFIITDSWAEKPAGHWYYLGTKESSCKTGSMSNNQIQAQVKHGIILTLLAIQITQIFR